MSQFRKTTTCFSQLFSMNRCNVQAELFKYFMLLEVQGSSNDVFIIHVNRFTLRFIHREFAIISSLNCWDDVLEFDFNTEELNKILSQYFGGRSSISKQELIDSCNNKVWVITMIMQWSFPFVLYSQLYHVGGAKVYCLI